MTVIFESLWKIEASPKAKADVGTTEKVERWSFVMPHRTFRLCHFKRKDQLRLHSARRIEEAMF